MIFPGSCTRAFVPVSPQNTSTSGWTVWWSSLRPSSASVGFQMETTAQPWAPSLKHSNPTRRESHLSRLGSTSHAWICSFLFWVIFILKHRTAFLWLILIMFCLQAASTPLSPLTFQCEFVKLRIDTLQALSQLICTCNSLKTSPPPAIATTIALSSGSDLQRCGRISTQVLKNIYMSNLYACIFLCVFICFSDSLSNLPKILTSNCLRMACLLYVFCIWSDEIIHGWI